MQQDHAMVIRADAKAMGAVTALSFTHRRKPRTSAPASECISYFNEDKSDARIFRATRATVNRKPNRRRMIVAQANDISLMAKMGTIHNPNEL
jgi:hypothetical protein